MQMVLRTLLQFELEIQKAKEKELEIQKEVEKRLQAQLTKELGNLKLDCQLTEVPVYLRIIF